MSAMGTAASPATYNQDASNPHWSVARYQKLIEHGILTSQDKVELLENLIVLTLPRTPAHDGANQVCAEILFSLIPAGWNVRPHLTVVFTDSQPEPDFAVVRGDRRTRAGRHPGPADVGLLIEVADSSLLRDQRDKTRIYARGNIPIYWIVNLPDRQVEVYTQPSGPTAVPSYGAMQTYMPGDQVPLILDGATVATVAVANLLP